MSLRRLSFGVAFVSVALAAADQGAAARAAAEQTVAGASAEPRAPGTGAGASSPPADPAPPAPAADPVLTAAPAPAASGWHGSEGSARLDLRSGLSLRSNLLTAGPSRVSAKGGAISQVALAGAWFPRDGMFGAVARLEIDRYSLRGDPAGYAPVALVATGAEGMGGFAARLAPGSGRTTLEGYVGYAYAQVPVARVSRSDASTSLMTVTTSGLSAHGPAAGARLAVSVMSWLGLETTARVMPLTFGARYDQSNVQLRRYAVEAGASVGHVERVGLVFAALLGYQLGATDGSGSGLEVSQIQHHIGLGVRAGVASPRRPSSSSSSDADGDAPPPPPPPTGRIRGVVRAATRGISPVAPSNLGAPPPNLGPRASTEVDVGAPVPGVLVEVMGSGGRTLTDAQGAFTLDRLAPGLVKLRLSARGWVGGEEVVSVPAEGEASAEMTLRASEAPPRAAVVGLVRTENGTPVAATVRVVELGLTVRADAKGAFRMEIPPGRYTLTIEASGFVAQRKSIQVGGGEENIYNVDLQVAP
jgi:hypothetical protein